jgi:hypothetical protein
MGKFAILLVILTSVFLLACASGASDGATHSAAEITAESTAANSNRTFDELKAIGPEGPAGGFATAESDAMDFGFGRAPAATPAPTAAPAPSALPQFQALRSEGDGASSSPLQAAQRMVISTASISVEVEMVQTAINNDVRAIAESLGGFVEQLSSSGGSERQQAHMTIRVPQNQFFTGPGAHRGPGRGAKPQPGQRGCIRAVH